MKLPLLAALICALATANSFALDPHVEAVIRTVEAAKGKVEKTDDGQSLRAVDLSVTGLGAHDKRTSDPYDAAFFEHLGHISTLESLRVISTQLNDEWIAPIGRLTNLKSLSFVNNGKLTDAGLEKLVGLKKLENFGFIGTAMKGHAFAKFEGWTQLKSLGLRGSQLDDEGLQYLCERFPNLETLGLAHAQITDAGAAHLVKLTRLKRLEIGARKGTPQTVRHLAKLPLEYLQLGDGLDSPDGIAIVKDIPTLRHFTITNGAPLTDDDLKLVATLRQLERLEFAQLEMPDERVPQLAAFASLKTLRIVRRPARHLPTRDPGQNQSPVAQGRAVVSVNGSALGPTPLHSHRFPRMAMSYGEREVESFVDDESNPVPAHSSVALRCRPCRRAVL